MTCLGGEDNTLSNALKHLALPFHSFTLTHSLTLSFPLSLDESREVEGDVDGRAGRDLGPVECGDHGLCLIHRCQVYDDFEWSSGFEPGGGGHGGPEGKLDGVCERVVSTEEARGSGADVGREPDSH